MALTEAKLEYHRKYREANKAKASAAFQRWHEKHGANRYYANLELTRAIKRKCYYKSIGDVDGANSEQMLVDELRAKDPKKATGAPQQYFGEEQRERRRATMRKVRYRHVEGVKSFMAPDKCEICGGGHKICMDHCHKTHKFRGWLCDDCNLALGRAKDDPRIVAAMLAYLKKHKGEA